MKTRRLTRCAFLCTLGAVLMYSSSLFPTLSLTITALAGAAPIIARLHFGTGAGIAVYTVTSVLSLIVLPAKDMAILFTVFFGCYPMLKWYFDKIKFWPFRLLAKLLYGNALLCILWVAARQLIFGDAVITPMAIAGTAVFINAFFVIYDIAVGRMKDYYMITLFRRFDR